MRKNRVVDRSKDKPVMDCTSTLKYIESKTSIGGELKENPFRNHQVIGK